MSKKEIIEDLNARLAELTKERDKLGAEADELMKKRDRLNEQFRNIRLEVSGLRQERDDANARVRELKLTRSELKNSIHDAIEELKKLRQSAKVLAQTKPRQSSATLQKELENIEWKIQTSSLNLEEEKQLIEQVKRLEAPLSIYKKLDRFHAKISEIETQLKVLDQEQKAVHNRITQIAQKSQETHEKMLKEIDEAKNTKTKADEAHRQLTLTRENEKPVRESIGNIYDQISRLKGEMREEETEKREQTDALLKESLERKAREKLKRGEKLTWEEFQVIAEKGLGAQD